MYVCMSLRLSVCLHIQNGTSYTGAVNHSLSCLSRVHVYVRVHWYTNCPEHPMGTFCWRKGAAPVCACVQQSWPCHMDHMPIPNDAAYACMFERVHFFSFPPTWIHVVSFHLVTVIVTVTVTRGLILHTRMCAPINDRNTTPAGTGNGARIQSQRHR